MSTQCDARTDPRPCVFCGAAGKYLYRDDYTVLWLCERHHSWWSAGAQVAGAEVATSALSQVIHPCSKCQRMDITQEGQKMAERLYKQSTVDDLLDLARHELQAYSEDGEPAAAQAAKDCIRLARTVAEIRESQIGLQIKTSMEDAVNLERRLKSWIKMW